ncbi:MAG: CcdB family protein [Gammaproteobacteria bacterium]
MEQFDVYKNPSATSSSRIPYLVDIQSPLLSQLITRIVIPLARLETLEGESIRQLCPPLNYGDESLVLLTTNIAGIRSNLLREPIGSLEHERETIVNALDFAICGF